MFRWGRGGKQKPSGEAMAHQKLQSFYAGPGTEERGTYTTGCGWAGDLTKGAPTMAFSTVGLATTSQSYSVWRRRIKLLSGSY